MLLKSPRSQWVNLAIGLRDGGPSIGRHVLTQKNACYEMLYVNLILMHLHLFHLYLVHQVCVICFYHFVLMFRFIDPKLAFNDEIKKRINSKPILAQLTGPYIYSGLYYGLAVSLCLIYPFPPPEFHTRTLCQKNILWAEITYHITHYSVWYTCLGTP